MKYKDFLNLLDKKHQETNFTDGALDIRIHNYWFENIPSLSIKIIDLKSQRVDWVHMSLNCYDWEHHNNLNSCYVLKTPGNLYVARTWAGENSLFGCKFYPDGSEMMGQDLEELKNWAKNKVLERGYRILDPKIKVMK